MSSFISGNFSRSGHASALILCEHFTVVVFKFIHHGCLPRQHKTFNIVINAADFGVPISNKGGEFECMLIILEILKSENLYNLS